MLKSLLGAAAAVSLLGVVACSQGPNEEAGEAADTAYEQSTTGTTDLGQGPAEEAGEAVDEAADGADAGRRHHDRRRRPPRRNARQSQLRLNSPRAKRRAGSFHVCARLPPALVLTLAIVAGASMDATIKYLAQTNHVLLVAFGRYLFGALFSLLIWWRAGPARRSRAEMWRAHGLRGFVIATCAVTFFWALSVLPLAEAVTLSFIYPLLAPFVAGVILKERMRPSSVICALIGFAGVIVAMQGAPSEAESPQHDLGVIAVLVSAGVLLHRHGAAARARAEGRRGDRRADDQRRAGRDPGGPDHRVRDAAAA